MFEPYVFRLNVLTPETTICLGQDGFQVFRQGDQTQTFPYAAVSSVRLSYEPSRASSDIYFCRIYLKGQTAPAITVSSTTYRGFLEFEPQFKGYRSFVASLHAKLARFGSSVAYRAGVGPFTYWGNAIFLTVVVVFSAILLIPIAANINLSGLIWIKLALIAFLTPLAIAWFWSNRPRPYDPLAVPRELLPQGEET